MTCNPTPSTGAVPRGAPPERLADAPGGAVRGGCICYVATLYRTGRFAPLYSAAYREAEAIQRRQSANGLTCGAIEDVSRPGEIMFQWTVA